MKKAPPTLVAAVLLAASGSELARVGAQRFQGGASRVQQCCPCLSLPVSSFHTPPT